MKQWFKLIVIVEALSLLAFWRPSLATVIFIVVCLAVLIVALIDLRYGLAAAFLELLIGGQGYLFVLPAGGLNLSIRQAIFIIVIGVALARKNFVKQNFGGFFFNYLMLGAAIAWGAVNALWSGRDFALLFFDANAFLFLGYLFVVLKERGPLPQWYGIEFSSAVAWLSFKTLAVFYLFSHDFQTITPGLYKWIRDTRVGEITGAAGGFYRIFFQSHIYLVLWLILAAVFFIYKLNPAPIPAMVCNNCRSKAKPPYGLNLRLLTELCQNRCGTSKEPPWRELAPPATIFVLALAAIILSFSRSLWLGLAVALLALLVTAWIYLRFSFREIGWSAWHLLTLVVISFSLVGFLSYFPYPARGNFSLVGLLEERAASFAEAAAKSRWQLLPPLLSEIKKHWLLGSGFGTSVTYQSADPRVLAVSPKGWYTTAAFEWGWLDIWLKIGLVGVAAYLFLLKKIWQRGWHLVKIERHEKWLPLGLNFTLLALVIIHFFTPYLNHPLGIGWLMVLTAIF